MPTMIGCATCQSPNVTRDALAAWDYDVQAWKLQTVLDQCNSDVCGGETRLQDLAPPFKIAAVPLSAQTRSFSLYAHDPETCRSSHDQIPVFPCPAGNFGKINWEQIFRKRLVRRRRSHCRTRPFPLDLRL